MAKDPTIPFYAQDFYLDTIQWEEAEVGAYIRLLCTMWINGFCHNSAIELANVSPLAKKVIEKYPNKFIFNDNGTVQSKRLEIERAKRIKNREIRSIAGKKGAEVRWQSDSKRNGKAIAKDMAKGKEKGNENVNSNVNDIYNEWNLKKIIIHEKLTNEIRNKIKTKLKDYSVEDIRMAINNYSIILRGDYYFKYKWTLRDFLQKGLEKFMNLEIAEVNYKNKPKAVILTKKQKRINHYVYKCPSCNKEYHPRVMKGEDDFDAYRCDENDCQKIGLGKDGKNMVGYQLEFQKRVYKE